MNNFFRKSELHYGGYAHVFIRSKWLTIWFVDYRRSTLVPLSFTLDIYSKLFGYIPLIKI